MYFLVYKIVAKAAGQEGGPVRKAAHRYSFGELYRPLSAIIVIRPAVHDEPFGTASEAASASSQAAMSSPIA